jgi:hypothetical protein
LFQLWGTTAETFVKEEQAAMNERFFSWHNKVFQCTISFKKGIYPNFKVVGLKGPFASFSAVVQ